MQRRYPWWLYFLERTRQNKLGTSEIAIFFRQDNESMAFRRILTRGNLEICYWQWFYAFGRSCLHFKSMGLEMPIFFTNKMLTFENYSSDLVVFDTLRLKRPPLLLLTKCIDFYEASKTDTINLKPELTTATMQVQGQPDRYHLPLFLKNGVFWWHGKNQYSPREFNVSAFKKNQLLYYPPWWERDIKV